MNKTALFLLCHKNKIYFVFFFLNRKNNCYFNKILKVNLQNSLKIDINQRYNKNINNLFRWIDQLLLLFHAERVVEYEEFEFFFAKNN
jgi:uncharacterized protein YdeI (YjbR/CyaY-like superfamily)